MRLGVAAMVAGQSMIFGLAVNLSPPERGALLVIHGVLAVAAVVVFLLAGLPILREAVRGAMRGRVVMEQLFLAGIAAAFGVSVHSTLTGHGSVYYEVVAILVAIHAFGRLIGERRRRAALEAARELGREFEMCERVVAGGGVERIGVAEVAAGERVVVRGGAPVPVDGVVVEGTAFVGETALTGEPFPVVKRVGDGVLAGSHSVDGMLVVEASAGGGKRRLDGLLESVRRAQEGGSGLQREADRLVGWFLPAVLAVSVATLVFWTWREGWVVGVFNSLAVVLVACPCSMGLATPVGIWSALAGMARRGVVARDGDLVERLGRVDTVVFDKTGTLGREELERVDFVEAEGVDRGSVLRGVARLEASSGHPVARAFREAGVEAVETRLVPGAGVAGVVDGVEMVVGNEAVLPAGEVAVARRLRERLRGGGTHHVYVVAGGRVAGVAGLRERLRDSALEAIEALEREGVRCEVMTGDRPEAAAVHGFSNVRAGLSPEGKAALVREMVAEGRRVLFVGDGVNDAPAMGAAQVALAIGDGSALARETAAGELLGGNLGAVPWAVVRCRRALRAIHTNVRVAAVYNLAGISLAAAGVLHPVVAALLMLVSSFTVTALALREGGSSRPLSRGGAAGNRGAGWMRPRWRVWLPAGGLALQGPAVVYLGGFGGLVAAGFVLLFLLAAAVCAWGLAGRGVGPLGEMVVGMFGAGGLAMLIGWWADAGFGAVVRNGVCLCNCADSTMGLGIFATLNWMDVSMVLASAQVFLIERAGSRGVVCWVAGVGGMLVGMEVAAWVMAMLPPTHPQGQFFATYGAMMLGMCAGMVAVCGALRRGNR
jgi:P-type Cu+ transporter